MAATYSSDLNSFIYSAVIQNHMMATLGEHALPMTWCREYDVRGKGSMSVQVGYMQSIYGAGDDDGVDVDTAYDIVENVCLTPISFQSAHYNITCKEYGVATCISDGALENVIGGLDLLDRIENHLQRAIALAWTRDFVDQFQNLTQIAGISGAALTVADVLAAQAMIRESGTVVSGGLVAVLNNKQVRDLEGELVASTGAAATYASCADKLIGCGMGDNYGLGESRHVLSLRGMPVFATGIGAQAGGDEVGAIFVPSSPANDAYATFGNVIGRSLRLETDRDVLCRTTNLAMTACLGVGILQNLSGVQLLTGGDAPVAP